MVVIITLFFFSKSSVYLDCGSTKDQFPLNTSLKTFSQSKVLSAKHETVIKDYLTTLLSAIATTEYGTEFLNLARYKTQNIVHSLSF